MNFNLKRPCGNCPFRREGAIPLQPGRAEGIVADLLADDHRTFQCHKTVHGPKGGEWTDDGQYVPSGEESACMGAVGYLWKCGRTSVLTRLALLTDRLTAKDIEATLPLVINPK